MELLHPNGYEFAFNKLKSQFNASGVTLDKLWVQASLATPGSGNGADPATVVAAFQYAYSIGITNFYIEFTLKEESYLPQTTVQLVPNMKKEHILIIMIGGVAVAIVVYYLATIKTVSHSQEETNVPPETGTIVDPAGVIDPNTSTVPVDVQPALDRK